MRVVNPVQSDLGHPSVFRTASSSVMRSLLDSGSIWLRSAAYYQQIEDQARADRGEGFSSASTRMPLEFHPPGGIRFRVEGAGRIGQHIVPHYIACFHASSISEEQRRGFGGHTAGVRCFARLAIDIAYQCAKQVTVTGYRYGPVSYRNCALGQALIVDGSTPIQMHGAPPLSLGVIETDVMVKSPCMPFIDQDEWRVAVFTLGHLGDDALAPLKVHVDPGHFYPYIVPVEPSAPNTTQQPTGAPSGAGG